VSELQGIQILEKQRRDSAHLETRLARLVLFSILRWGNSLLTLSQENQAMNTSCPTARRVYRPNVKILESANALELVAEVPGADENSTELTIEHDTLTLRAHGAADSSEGRQVVYSEYGDRTYERSFHLSDAIDRQKIEAKVKDGVLHVVLPKAEHVLTKKVAVLAG
jgi:HSP20 family protein